VLNEISTHVQRFGTGPGEVIVTNRLGKVAQRNAFGDRWRLAVAVARTCGKPSVSAFEGGQCGVTSADPDAEDLGRGAIDAIFAVVLTEQERNQETW
jgi:hypothetical protein